MKIKQVFQTEDGVLHDSEFSAKEHLKKLISEDELNFKSFCESYCGRTLLEKHKLGDYGIWKILGEDLSCDFGGYHNSPYLGTVEGELEQVIKYAISLKSFYTWGSGGEIVKVDVKKL